ncbi:MAG: phosphate uptake regulator PhoU [Natronomonas sp.]
MGRITDSGNSPIERKVQVTGGSTYTVSLPKGWANDREIASGSPVHLYPFEDRLVVAQPDGAVPTHRAEMNVDSVGETALAGRIEAAYAAGVDKIVVESDTGFDSSRRRLVTESITSLVGIEIATETDHEIVATSLLDPSEISLDGTIDQIRQISLSMHENAISTIVSADSTELANHIISRDDDVDRLFALVSRQFYRALNDVREADKLGTDRKMAFTRFRIARQLERIADHAERIAEVAIRQESPPPAELGESFEAIATDARRVVRTAIDGNAGEALLRRDDVIEQLDELDRELYDAHGDDTYLYGRVLESIRRTTEYGGNVAEIITLADIAETENT